MIKSIRIDYSVLLVYLKAACPEIYANIHAKFIIVLNAKYCEVNLASISNIANSTKTHVNYLEEVKMRTLAFTALVTQ
jgi:hypothetical protein